MRRFHPRVGESADFTLKVRSEKEDDLDHLLREFRNAVGSGSHAVDGINWENGEVQFSGFVYPNGEFAGVFLTAEQLQSIARLLPDYIEKGRKLIALHDSRIHQERYHRSISCDHEFVAEKYLTAVGADGNIEVVLDVICSKCGWVFERDITDQFSDGTLADEPADDGYYVSVPVGEGWAKVLEKRKV